jgi:hypothetical protein
MLALLAALALQTSPPPPPVHHLFLHVGGHVTIELHDTHVRSWSVGRAGVVALSDVRVVHKGTTMRITATNAGSTSVVVGCAAGRQEVWLVDVR